MGYAQTIISPIHSPAQRRAFSSAAPTRARKGKGHVACKKHGHLRKLEKKEH
jgi:hypothetical protein